MIKNDYYEENLRRIVIRITKVFVSYGRNDLLRGIYSK